MVLLWATAYRNRNRCEQSVISDAKQEQNGITILFDWTFSHTSERKMISLGLLDMPTNFKNI